MKDTELSNLPATEFILDSDPEWEFPRNKLQLAEGLGEGAFGKVVKGIADGILQKNVTNVVAVKMLKGLSIWRLSNQLPTEIIFETLQDSLIYLNLVIECYTDGDMIILVSEMEIMKMIGEHENVLKLLGCCSQGGKLLVITEYAPYGNLRDFLRQHHLSVGNGTDGHEESRNKFVPNERALVIFAYQVAKGMEYIAAKKVCIMFIFMNLTFIRLRERGGKSLINSEIGL